MCSTTSSNGWWRGSSIAEGSARTASTARPWRSVARIDLSRIQAPPGGARRQDDGNRNFGRDRRYPISQPLPQFRRVAAGARSLADAGRRAEERCIRFLSGRRQARTHNGRVNDVQASAGIALPTSIIGSLPRPNWYTAVLGSRSFLEAMVNSRYREQYEDAVSCFLRAQEIAASTSAPTVTRITTKKSGA